MDVQVEKSNFIKWLNEQTDVHLLQELKDLKDRYLGIGSNDKSAVLEKLLDVSMQQYKDGKTIEHSVFMEEVSKKYGKL